uniref:Uncharacterized protein n=1 Tax=Anguilla anguilla TaxID=7936 RepID=A0A0E9XFX3_ANGAN
MAFFSNGQIKLFSNRCNHVLYCEFKSPMCCQIPQECLYMWCPINGCILVKRMHFRLFFQEEEQVHVFSSECEAHHKWY